VRIFRSTLINCKFDLLPRQAGGYTTQSDDTAELVSGIKGVLTALEDNIKSGEIGAGTTATDVLHCEWLEDLEQSMRVKITERKSGIAWINDESVYQIVDVKDVSGNRREMRVLLLQLGG